MTEPTNITDLTVEVLTALLPEWQLALRAENKSPGTIEVYTDGTRRYLRSTMFRDELAMLVRQFEGRLEVVEFRDGEDVTEDGVHSGPIAADYHRTRSMTTLRRRWSTAGTCADQNSGRDGQEGTGRARRCAPARAQ
jgi:hypothetical protein